MTRTTCPGSSWRLLSPSTTEGGLLPGVEGQLDNGAAGEHRAIRLTKMGSERSKDHLLRLGMEDRAADGLAVRGAAGSRSDDYAVGAVVGHKLAVDEGANDDGASEGACALTRRR